MQKVIIAPASPGGWHLRSVMGVACMSPLLPRQSWLNFGHVADVAAYLRLGRRTAVRTAEG